MKKKEWNEGLNHLDSDLVEKYVEQKDRLRQKNKKPNSVWLRFGAVAACFCLIVSAIMVLPMLREDDTGVIPGSGTTDDTGVIPGSGITDDNNRPNIPIVNVQLPSLAPQYYGSEATGYGGASAEINTEGVSVIARLITVLPDTYTFYDDWTQTEFHLLKMETVKLLKGENMTDTFYYIVPESFMTDYTIFDKFVIVDMGQYGYENSVLYNKTQSCAERLDIVLLGYLNTYFYCMGENFMAFDSNGNFDGRLWGANEYWASSTGWPSNIMGQPNKYLNGYTIAQAEQDFYSDDGYRSVSVLDSVSSEAKEALEYIQSFENGLYIQRGDGFKTSHYPSVQLNFRRYMGGFATNESGMIYADSVNWSKARFTKEDEEKLPDLPSAYATIKDSFESGKILPPHIQNHGEMENTVNGIFGWYAKTEGGVIGVVRVTWCYVSNEYDLCFDDAYYIIEYGSNECKAIDRDVLLELLGDYETTYIYTGEYNEYGKYSDIIYPVV